MALVSINPAIGEQLASFEPMTKEEVLAAVGRSADTFRTYRKTGFPERARMMNAAAEILTKEQTIFGRLITSEMGKTYRAACDEVAKCAWACRHFSEHAEEYLCDRPIGTNASSSYIRYQPLGPVLAIMPWNFPFWQVFRFAAPALMAGNVCLLKHASNVPQCSVALQEIFRRAGFPEGSFISLLTGSETMPAVIGHPSVQAVTLTGSMPAGSSVAATAGKFIKKSVLELGGSDPFIVMPGAPVGEVVAAAVKARIVNNGQSCIAAKRFIIHEAVFDEFRREFVNRMESLRVGDPMDENTDIGPLATMDILHELDEQVVQSVRMGARLLTGGHRTVEKGYFYPPTVITNIPRGAPVFREEVFGPAALLFSVRDIDEAISLANYSSFGLGSSAWTPDGDEQERFINELEAGLVFINGMVVSDPRLPFGGVKSSGYGRELGADGIREFVNVKSVWIK